MEMIYIDTRTDLRGQELYTKMVKSDNWRSIKYKKLIRKNAMSFTIGFDSVLQRKDDPSKFVFITLRESNSGKTKTFHFKEQQTANYNGT